MTQVISQGKVSAQVRRINLWIGAVVLTSVLVLGTLMFLAFR